MCKEKALTYVRLVEDVTVEIKGIKITLGKDLLGVTGGSIFKGKYVVHFSYPGCVELLRESFRYLEDEDELKVVDVEVGGIGSYTLVEDQLNTSLETIISDLEFEELEDQKALIMLTVRKATLSEVMSMPEFQGF